MAFLESACKLLYFPCKGLWIESSFIFSEKMYEPISFLFAIKRFGEIYVAQRYVGIFVKMINC